MDAVLLAGGFGTRLRPLTYTRPKPLLPVAGRAMVEWVLDRLPPEVDHVIVAVNWQAEALRRYFAASPRKLRFTVVEEAEPLGTGGAVGNCRDHLSSEWFFVLNADIVSSMDLGALLAARSSERAGILSLRDVPRADTVHFGAAEIGDSDDTATQLTGFVEKPSNPELAPSTLINAGAYLLHRQILQWIPEGKLVSMEKEVFPRLLPDKLWGVPFVGEWIDVGDPARLLAANKMLGGGDDVVGQNCAISGTLNQCIVGDNVTVLAGVHLENCVVGDGETVTQSQRDARIWTKAVPPGYPEKQVGNAIG